MLTPIPPSPALLVYRVFRKEPKRTTKIVHGLLHVFAFVIALVGEFRAQDAPSPVPLSPDLSLPGDAPSSSRGKPCPHGHASGPGLVAVFDYHKKKGYQDLYSLHSWCGLLVFILYLVQVSPSASPANRCQPGVLPDCARGVGASHPPASLPG